MQNPKKRIVLVLGFLLLFSLVLVSCTQEPEQVEVTVEVPVQGPEVEVTRIVTETVTETVTEEVMVDVPGEPPVALPFFEAWASSGHADAEAEAFRHWDEDDPQVVSESCAKCHSSYGYLDFIGADGTEAGVVDAPAAIDSTVECETCHNAATVAMTSVVFPSGVEVMGLGSEARCMQCHQGRESTVSVDQRIADAGLVEGDDDMVSEDLGFANIHYYAAAATMYGTVTKGGYEYAGKAYDGKFDHVPGYDACVDCHSPHTLEVKFEECTACHQGLESAEDLLDVRMFGSFVDYDGDGDDDEGVYYEVEGLRGLLYQAIQAYAAELGSGAVAYDSHSYPYFFFDTNEDGEAGVDEANFGNRYVGWTPRMLKAAYNFQTSLKDPGLYAHGGKYIIQLLYDSTESLNEVLATPVDLSAANRLDHGHFAGSEEAFRHWDEDGAVPGSCARCHSADGLPQYLELGVNSEQPTANGLNCATCHDDLTTFTRYESASVKFPSGETVSFEDPEANLCLNCHQGRESTVSLNADIAADAAGDDDTVSEDLGFANVHYFAAGASLFGTEAKGAYEYDGQEYLGRFEHVGPFDTCIECHSTHALEVKVASCGNCHDGVTAEEDLHDIRMSGVDYDGDGDIAEGMASEIETMTETLLAGMQAYAVENGAGILYDSHSYPYYFTDTNGDGEGTPDEVNYGNRYASWTPRLLRAAYNYQYAQKDPGAFAHNGQYMVQVLFDSLTDIGADTSAMTRP